MWETNNAEVCGHRIQARRLPCEGFAVWDEAGAKRPGILVYPEWGGVGEYTHKRAQMLGELGFNAFVVDVYGKGIRPNTPESKLAAIGYCFVGTLYRMRRTPN